MNESGYLSVLRASSAVQPTARTVLLYIMLSLTRLFIIYPLVGRTFDIFTVSKPNTVLLILRVHIYVDLRKVRCRKVGVSKIIFQII